MIKILLSLFIILGLSACKERRGPEPETSKFTEKLFSGTSSTSSQKVFTQERTPIKNTPIKEVTPQTSISNSETIVKEVPILEDDLPVLPTPIQESTPTLDFTLEKQTFRGGTINDGLDMKVIRSSQDAIRTRLVFDSYTLNGKATQSGNYIFTYNPSTKQIIAVINGYRKFSALSSEKIRTFPNNRIIKNIKMEKYMDDSGFKFNISLKNAASVKVFELKAPARIVVDITPN